MNSFMREPTTCLTESPLDTTFGVDVDDINPCGDRARDVGIVGARPHRAVWAEQLRK
jgi:hypothetical protein